MLHVTQGCCCVVTDVACDVTQGCFCVVTDFVCHSGMFLCCYRFCVSLRDVAVLLQILCVSQGCCCVVTDFVCLSGMLLCCHRFCVSLRDVAVFVAEVGVYGIMLQSLACH